MNDQLREQFERWILSNGGSIDRTDGGEYRSAPTECAWIAWLAHEDHRIKMAAEKHTEKIDRLGKNETGPEHQEAPRMFPKRFRLKGNKLKLSIEFNGPIGIALIYSQSGELIFACWPFVFRLTWGY